MMQNKRSVGVTLLALIMLTYGAICLHLYGNELFISFNPLVLLFSLRLVRHPFDGVIFIIASAFILIRKNWAREFAIIASWLLLLCYLPTAISMLKNPHHIYTSEAKDWYGLPSETAVLCMTYIPLILYVLFICFLSHPKVKEQFIGEGMTSEKSTSKRSIGVTIWSIYFFVSPFIKFILHYRLRHPVGAEAVIAVTFIIYIVNAIGLFMLKEWARKITIVLSCLGIFVGIVLFKSNSLAILVCAINLGAIYYFTRPQVKEQFKKSTFENITLNKNTGGF